MKLGNTVQFVGEARAATFLRCLRRPSNSGFYSESCDMFEAAQTKAAIFKALGFMDISIDQSPPPMAPNSGTRPRHGGG